MNVTYIWVENTYQILIQNFPHFGLESLEKWQS